MMWLCGADTPFGFPFGFAQGFGKTGRLCPPLLILIFLAVLRNRRSDSVQFKINVKGGGQ